MLHSFRIPFPKNTWRAASVGIKINFEKVEKIRLDHDKNVWKFRLIFETQLHIQIHICYFKSLPIATYYLTKMHIKNLYLHSKTYHMVLQWNLYLTSLSRRGSVNPSTLTFVNINLTETIANLIVAMTFNQKRLKQFLFAT